MIPSVNTEWHVAERDDARLAVVTDRRQPDDAAGRENIDAQDTDVTLHHTLEASRASAHLLAMLRCPTGVLASGLDIEQSLREQLLKR
jgi:hypothetical protein